MIDFNSLTMGEVALVESLSKQSISSIANEDAPKGNALAALALVFKRRNGQPTFKFNDALLLTLDEVNELLGLNEPEPEEASDEGKADGSSESETN